jgi:heme-degrading monooxygenase HmoA
MCALDRAAAQMKLITTTSVQNLYTMPKSAPIDKSVNASTMNRARAANEQCNAGDHCPPDATNFVALSRFTVAHMSDQVKQAFRQRPHRVDTANGFVRMEVLSPCDSPNEIWLITYWTDESSYRTWHHSHLYQESHVGIPKGLRLVPKSVSIRCFEHVAS